MPVKEADRAEFEAFGDLGFDTQGREILVGLSYDETEWYLAALERDRSGQGFLTGAEIDRKSILDDRHTAVRLKLAEAAHEARFKSLRSRFDWHDVNTRSPAIHPGAVALAANANTKRRTA